jgi:hypothetical protein
MARPRTPFAGPVPFLAALAGSLLPAQIQPGHVVVARVGDGTATLSNASTAVFLDEYTATGTFVQTIALPTSGSGAQRPLTCSGTATSEGALTQSADGRFLVLAGYGIAPGGASVASSVSSSVPRVVGRVALDEAIDTSTALVDAYSGNNVRGAASFAGGEFWTAGTASAANNPGVRYCASLGATQSTLLDTTITNIRRVDLWNGQLYCATASGTAFGVCTVGTGLPTTAGQTTALLPGFPTTTGPSPYDFFFASATTLYVADDRTTAGGGIQKWTLAGGTWTLQYTLTAGTGVGCRGLTGTFTGGAVTLWTTTTANVLARVLDTGPTAPLVTLITGNPNTALRGVRFVRTPASTTFSGTPCATTVGTPFVGVVGEPVIGNTTFQLAADATPPSTIVLFSVRGGPPATVGVPLPGAPPCVLVYVLPDVLAAATADAFGAARVPLPIPYDAALGGLRLGVQAFPLDLALTGFVLPFGSTDALEIVVGN